MGFGLILAWAGFGGTFPFPFWISSEGFKTDDVGKPLIPFDWRGAKAFLGAARFIGDCTLGWECEGIEVDAVGCIGESA